MSKTILVVLLLFAARDPSDGEAPSLAAVVTHRVHPVLIRSLHCEIGQITVTVKSDAEVVLEGLTVSLEGTTDLSDLDSVEIFHTPSQPSFSPGVSFGKPSPPRSKMSFEGRIVLRRGENILWMSCRLRNDASLDHRVAAECTELRTSRGILIPRIQGPRDGHRIGVALRKAGEDQVHTYRIPALGTSARGTLLCVYDVRRRSSRDLQGDIDVGLSRSTDGGQTWEPMRIILDMGLYGGLPQEQNGVGDPGLVIDQQTGEVFVFALWVHGKPGKHQWRGDGSEPGFEIGKTAQTMLIRSTDDGLTWSPPENLTRQVKREEWHLFAPSPQQGIQLRDGTLVMPVQGRDVDGSFAAIMTSDDHGRTWRVSSRAYSGGNECQVAELADGTLMLNIRNDDRKRRAVVTTKDLGKSWDRHATHEMLLEPTCNGSLYRWTHHQDPAESVLLFANPRDEALRIRQTIQLSRDDGMTWPVAQRLLLDDGPGFGYPSLSRVDDDHIGIVYEGSQAHLVFERIARKEFGAPPRDQRIP